MANESGNANTSEISEATNILQLLIEAYRTIQPAKMYALNGIARQLTFDTGMQIDLEKRTPCLVVLALPPELAAMLPTGQTDISELIEMAKPEPA